MECIHCICIIMCMYNIIKGLQLKWLKSKKNNCVKKTKKNNCVKKKNEEKLWQ